MIVGTMPFKKIAYSAILTLVLWPTFVFADYDAIDNRFEGFSSADTSKWALIGLNDGMRLDIVVNGTTSYSGVASLWLAICNTGTSAGRLDLEIHHLATTSEVSASSTLPMSAFPTTGCGLNSAINGATSTEFDLNNYISQTSILPMYISIYARGGLSGTAYFSWRNVDLQGSYVQAYRDNILQAPLSLGYTYSPWLYAQSISEFGSGIIIDYNASTTSSTCTTWDIGCYIMKGIESSLTANNVVLSGVLNDVKDEVLYSFPLGILTDTISIMGTTSTTSLPELYIQVPYEFANGQLSGASAILSLDHVLDPLLNATSSYHNDVFAASTVTFYDRTEVYWLWLLRVALLLYILRRLFGSHIIPTFWEATEFDGGFYRGKQAKLIKYGRKVGYSNRQIYRDIKELP